MEEKGMKYRGKMKRYKKYCESQKKLRKFKQYLESWWLEIFQI